MDEPRSELGYVDEFELEDDQLRSTSGDIVCVVTEALVEHLYRFEGPSDRPLRLLRKSRSVAVVTGDHAATVIDVTVTCGSADEARAVIRAVVDARLAACGQTWPITSCYRWRGEVAVDGEHLVLLKTLAEHFDAICAVIRAHHSYELPAIAAIPLSHAGPGFVDWIVESTGPQA